jgi:prepilin-type N-terminal cleavage/methylation domain-containing protein
MFLNTKKLHSFPRNFTTTSESNDERLRSSSPNAVRVKSRSGFTLIELLVVIAIIGLLSSVVLASLSGARESARIARAQSDLDGIHTATQLLLNDTGKYPGGCRPGQPANATLPLYDKQSGLVERPDVGSLGLYEGAMHNETECKWSSDDVAEWNGPYINTNADFVDPWDLPYYFDPTYIHYGPPCDHPTRVAVIYSRGPTGVAWPGPGIAESPNTCDDIRAVLDKETSL